MSTAKNLLSLLDNGVNEWGSDLLVARKYANMFMYEKMNELNAGLIIEARKWLNTEFEELLDDVDPEEKVQFKKLFEQEVIRILTSMAKRLDQNRR